MRTRIAFRTWGLRGVAAERRLPAYAVGGEMDFGPFGRIEAVKRSVARATGLVVCACSPQGTALENGAPESEHYQLTLGRPCRSGGYSVEGSLWVAVPIA